MEMISGDVSDLWVQKMRTVFFLLDVNKDGYYSYADRVIMAGQKFTSEGHLSPERARAFMEEREQAWNAFFGDVKLVTFEQFEEKFKMVIYNKQIHDYIVPILKGMHRSMFDVIDTDGNGSISKLEYRSWCQWIGIKGTVRADIGFDLIDTSQNGSIEFDEYFVGAYDYYTNLEPSKFQTFYGQLISNEGWNSYRADVAEKHANEQNQNGGN